MNSKNEIWKLIDEAQALGDKGLYGEAKNLLLPKAESGNVCAMTELAKIAHLEGKIEERYDWIDKAESALRLGNEDDHNCLRSVYANRLSRHSGEHQFEREFFHLEQLCRSGNPVAQQMLALQYLNGSNNREVSIPKFEYWIKKSIKGGMSESVYIYVNYLFKNDKDIPFDLINTLQEIRKEQKSVDRLLKSIDIKNQTNKS